MYLDAIFVKFHVGRVVCRMKKMNKRGNMVGEEEVIEKNVIFSKNRRSFWRIH